MQASSSILESNNFTSKLSEKLLAFSENEQFSDICIITSDDVRFHAHKCVLSAFSDYFMLMFGGSLKESTASEVKIHEVNGKIFKPILAFLYTGSIELQNDTIEDILRAASFFQIQPLINECYNFMGEKLDTDNCLGIAIFAHQHGLVELFKKASNFASNNFRKISNQVDFLKLDEDQLKEIISSDNLCANSEEEIFFSLIKWIDHDKINREKSALNLFNKIQYWLLSPGFIKEHRSMLPKNPECLEMVCTWLERHSMPQSHQRQMQAMQISKPNKPTTTTIVGNPLRIDRRFCVASNLYFRSNDDKLYYIDIRTLPRPR